jgi:hypothetical protein
MSVSSGVLFLYMGRYSWINLCVLAVDFEQPRALWQKVFDNTAKDHFVSNIAGHLGNVKSSEVKARQRTSLSYSPSHSAHIAHILLSLQYSLRLRRRRPIPLGPHRQSHRPPDRKTPASQARLGGVEVQIRCGCFVVSGF